MGYQEFLKNADLLTALRWNVSIQSDGWPPLCWNVWAATLNCILKRVPDVLNCVVFLLVFWNCFHLRILSAKNVDGVWGALLNENWHFSQILCRWLCTSGRISCIIRFIDPKIRTKYGSLLSFEMLLLVLAGQRNCLLWSLEIGSACLSVAVGQWAVLSSRISE